MRSKLLEILGIAMIGEGLVGLASPARYVGFWNIGPAPLRKAMTALADHPNLTRAICAAEAAAGFWLAQSQLSGQRRSMHNKAPDTQLADPVEVAYTRVELVAEVG